jgi:hypothetical protein
MTPDNDNARPVTHYPPLPPRNPLFGPLIASIPVTVARQGSAATARRLQQWLEDFRAKATPERLRNAGVTPFDLAELDVWLTSRIRELEN